MKKLSLLTALMLALMLFSCSTSYIGVGGDISRDWPKGFFAPAPETGRIAYTVYKTEEDGSSFPVTVYLSDIAYENFVSYIASLNDIGYKYCGSIPESDSVGNADSADASWYGYNGTLWLHIYYTKAEQVYQKNNYSMYIAAKTEKPSWAAETAAD